MSYYEMLTWTAYVFPTLVNITFIDIQYFYFICMVHILTCQMIDHTLWLMGCFIRCQKAISCHVFGSCLVLQNIINQKISLVKQIVIYVIVVYIFMSLVHIFSKSAWHYEHIFVVKLSGARNWVWFLLLCTWLMAQ